MSQINLENVIRISKGFMKNFVIPAYKQLKPIIDKEMTFFIYYIRLHIW